MGFFDKKVICDTCGEEVGLNRFKTAEGWICPKCFKACGYTMTTPIKTKTIVQIRGDLVASQNNLQTVESFTPTKKIGTYIEFDETQKKWLVPDGFMGKKKNPKVYNYYDVLDCDLLEDENSITKGGLGAAVAGGILFGGAGAVAGSVLRGKKTKSVVNSMKIKITLKSTSDPVVYINLLTTSLKTSSLLYKSIESSAQEILSIFAVILNENKSINSAAAQPATSNADDIRKFKALLDDGIITQEEFEAKKNQLLGL